MADIFVVTPTPITISTNGTPGTALDIRLAHDVSRWDSIDLQVGLLSLVTATSFTIEFLTSMQMDIEGKDWDVLVASPKSRVGTLTITTAGPTYDNITLPATNPLYRYLRWRAWVNAAASSATFVVSGMGRKKGS